MKVLYIKENSKILVLKKTEEGMTIGEPKDFDFSNFEAGQNKRLIENLQKNAQNIEASLEEIFSDIAILNYFDTQSKKRKHINTLKKAKKVKRNYDYSVLNDCYKSWIESLSNGAKDPRAPSGCHVFNISKISNVIPENERYYFGICEPQQFSSIDKVNILRIGENNQKNYSLCKQNHENEKKILNRCFCGVWGSQHTMKTHFCPFDMDFKFKEDKIYIQFKEGKEAESLNEFQFFLVCNSKESNLNFKKIDDEVFAPVNRKDLNNGTYIACRHSETNGIVVKIKQLDIRSTKKSLSTQTPKSSKTPTLFSIFSEFSMTCSITYMLIMYCSIKKVPLEKMKNDYMISNDDLINQRDSDDLKKDIFDLDKNAILGKNGLFWLIFFNQDDSNLLEQLQHEFKEEFEHQMKFVEKYRKVDSGLISRIKDIVLDYRYGFDQSIQDYIDSLEYDEEEEE
jgi:hypothetical protein